MKNIEEYVDIKKYSTLRVGGQFRYLIKVEKKEELHDIYSFAKEKNIPVFILGGGSNMIFSDGIVNVIALKIEIKGFEIINETQDFVDIKVGAGENWDSFVEKTVYMNLVGVESLSLIPGTVGATPVQNVGAYGSEVKNTITSVEVYDIENNLIKNILNTECKFDYRDSIFKNEYKNKYVITSVVFRLTKSVPMIPKYPGVLKYFEDREITNPTLAEIRDAIIYIRTTKLPDPKILPNVGSFFKNPIVSNDVADRIKLDNPDARFFLLNDSFTKIPAGWLIEKSGLKGVSLGNVIVYDKNALVLVNNNNASFMDMIKARDQIIEMVKNKFGIVLEQEPEIV